MRDMHGDRGSDGLLDEEALSDDPRSGLKTYPPAGAPELCRLTRSPLCLTLSVESCASHPLPPARANERQQPALY